MPTTGDKTRAQQLSPGLVEIVAASEPTAAPDAVVAEH